MTPAAVAFVAAAVSCLDAAHVRRAHRDRGFPSEPDPREPPRRRMLPDRFDTRTDTMKRAALAVLVLAAVAAGGYLGITRWQASKARAVSTAAAPAPVSARTAGPATAVPGQPSPAGTGAAPADVATPSGPAEASGIGSLASSAGTESGAPPPPPPPPAPPMASGLPATVTTVNVAAMAIGGEIERLTGAYAAGHDGHRLIDGANAPTWRIDAPVTYPQEAVFSFYDRQPALVGAVAVVLPADASLAPHDVEVWASNDSPSSGFVRIGAQTLAAQPGEQTIAFPAVEARFVELRVLNGASPKGLEIADVRVLEAARDAYSPLLVRNPRATWWDGSPRAAAQRGLDWLEQAAPDWQTEHNCFGCHVQAQVLMGQAIALQQHYRVDMAAMHAIEDGTRKYQEHDNSWFGGSSSATVFGALGLASADEASGAAAIPSCSRASTGW